MAIMYNAVYMPHACGHIYLHVKYMYTVLEYLDMNSETWYPYIVTIIQVGHNICIIVIILHGILHIPVF